MSDTSVVVVQDQFGKIEVVCHPFEPDADDYAGERHLAIMYDGREESFAILKADQCAALARLLTSETQRPAGIESGCPDEWSGDGAERYRCVWTASNPYDIQGVVVQWFDGTVSAHGDEDGPHVHIGDDRYTTDEARVIAQHLKSIADQVDSWVTTAK